MHFMVTGGAGFIGSHVAEQLLSEGHTVTVVDNLTTGCLTNLPDHPRLKRLQNNILTTRPQDFPDPIDGLAHLAATPSVTESWAAPLEAHHNNLSTTLAVIQLCRELAIPRLVFASSAAVYGNPQTLPIAETHPTHPISPYGLQKLSSEQYLRLFAEQFGFSAVNLRLFNVFGPRQNPNSQYSGVISIFTQRMAQGLPITIYGDGQQTRDFVFVKDVAIAFAKALTIPLAAGECLTSNVGTSRAVSLLQLVEGLEACFPNWPRNTKIAPSRLGDIQHSQADISNLLGKLGVQPRWSLKSGIESLVQSLAPNNSLDEVYA